MYFAPNTDAGFLDAITTAIHDTTHKPSVISLSWGGAESTWTPQAMTAMDAALQAAATLGITVCVASGDGGSSDGVSGGGSSTFLALPNWQAGLKAANSQGQSMAQSQKIPEKVLNISALDMWDNRNRLWRRGAGYNSSRGDHCSPARGQQLWRCCGQRARTKPREKHIGE